MASLRVVGTGMQLGQALQLAAACIAQADHVLYIVQDPLMKAWISELNPRAEDLVRLYGISKRRYQTYGEMVARVLQLLDAGSNVCLAVYGHPGFSTRPTHDAIREARKRGHDAGMVPGISALDCLSADLGIDPVLDCTQVAEATEFLLFNRKPDPTAGLALFQIGVTANLSATPRINRKGLQALTRRLSSSYKATQEIILYESAIWPIVPSKIERIKLRDLPKAALTSATTLYIPPVSRRKLDKQLAQNLSLLPKEKGSKKKPKRRR